MITIPVTYVLGQSSAVEMESFEATPLPMIALRDSNEATLRGALSAVPPEARQVVSDLYRELVLANFAKCSGKGGASAEPELSRVFPDGGTLPGFVRKSGRFNASGMILHNARIYRSTGKGYAILPAVLSALIEGGFPQPRCSSRVPSPTAVGFAEEPEGNLFVEGSVRRVLVNAYERDAGARQACLDHYGYDCICCGFNF
jgi:hypothetical protein